MVLTRFTQELAPLIQQKGVTAIKRKDATNENNQRTLLTIKGYLKQDKTLQQITDELNAAGFWSAKAISFIEEKCIEY